MHNRGLLLESEGITLYLMGIGSIAELKASGQVRTKWDAEDERKAEWL